MPFCRRPNRLGRRLRVFFCIVAYLGYYGSCVLLPSFRSLFVSAGYSKATLQNCCHAEIVFCFSYRHLKLICFSRIFLPYSSQRATPRLHFARFLHLSTPPRRQEHSSPAPVDGICGICHKSLLSELIVVLCCDHVFHHSCIDDVLRVARCRAALSGRVTVDGMMCGAPAIVSLRPGFGHVGQCRPRPRQVRAVRAGDGIAGDDADGPSEPRLSARWFVRLTCPAR